MSKRNPAPLGITQADLERFQQLEADRKELGVQFDKCKAELIEKLRAGAPIQDGALTAESFEEKRKFPPWKEDYIRCVGQGAADELIAHTEETKWWNLDVHRRSRFVRTV